MQIELTTELKDKLRAIRAKQLAGAFFVDDFLKENEVVGLTLGMGPRVYLRLDGKVMVWDTDGIWLDNLEPHVSEESDDVVSAVILAAEKFDEPDFLKLLPAMPENGQPCSFCNKTRRWTPNKTDGKPWSAGIICPKCKGLAWVLAD